MHIVYILYSAKLDRYYTGATDNLEDRLRRHNGGRSLATKAGVPWELVYIEAFDTKPVRAGLVSPTPTSKTKTASAGLNPYTVP